MVDYDTPLTLFVVPQNDYFSWQLDLFTFAYDKLGIKHNIKVILIERNNLEDQKVTYNKYKTKFDHEVVQSYFDFDKKNRIFKSLGSPLNIQYGLFQILDTLPDEQRIELIESDMFHLFNIYDYELQEDTIIADDVYESWHLKSKTAPFMNRLIKNPQDITYNGGFLPLIMRAKILKRIIKPWIITHKNLLQSDIPKLKKWWAGMYSLQIACQNEKINMQNRNDCYIPGYNKIDNKRICHYSVDPYFTKKTYPNIDYEELPNNKYYNIIRDWKNANNQ